MALTQQSRIIVLHLTKYGDSGLVVHAIDSEAGRCSYMLRGAGRSGAAKAGKGSSAAQTASKAAKATSSGSAVEDTGKTIDKNMDA